MKSRIADLKNYPGSRASGVMGGGAIIAALFLREFVTKSDKLQWAHIDAAGESLLGTLIFRWICVFSSVLGI